ncbi:MAG TPA: SCP2 sterol-binding domain-containing protein [Xanthomonadaceae bacterium]|nr:SCP2 sterol-binding domain-containing protein [Xanthomonadaceae bacterium]
MSDSSAPTRNPVLDVLGRLLQGSLNRALALDTVTTEQVRTLEGRSVRVDLRHLDVAMLLTVHDGRLEVGPAGEKADLSLKASLGSLLSMALARGADAPFGKVEIAGDADLARRVEKLMRAFDPDWEEPLARAFGDIAGHQIAQGLRSAFGRLQRAASGFVGDAVDYLREESGDAVAKPEADQFYDEVDTLREAADRLEQRVQRLAEALARKGQGPA